MVSPNLTELVTTTLRDRQKEFADNVTTNNALLTRLKERGNIKTKDGGRDLVEPLSYAENGNFQYYSGYEILDISPTDMLSASNYEWKQAASNVSMSGLEKRINSGSNAVLDLLEGRIKTTMNTIKNQLSVGIYSDGTGSGGKQVGGLQLLVADDPTTGVVGGIDSAAFTFWQNTSFDATTDGGAAASATNMVGYMNTVYNGLVRGNDFPDLIVADTIYFGFYQAALQAQQRFADPSSKLAAAGFQVLKYANSDVVLENGSGIEPSHMYFLNTDFLTFTVHTDANMTPEPARQSVNQDAMVIPVLWMGNMTMSNRNLQGVIKD